MKILIGDSGLVGKSLMNKINFDFTFNSKNISEFNSVVTDNSDLYLSCLPATKWKVNKDIKNDMQNILNIIEIIKKHKYNKIILISTIDVYTDSPLLSNEDFLPIVKNLNYGSNRYLFELLVKQLECNNIQIYRLPALFSIDIKKNILYDLLNNHNVSDINYNSTFQWYNLNNLALDINKIDNKGVYNLFTEPIKTKLILDLFNLKESDVNNNSQEIIYNFKTKYTNSGYIQKKEDVLEDIKNFIYEFRNQSISV